MISKLKSLWNKFIASFIWQDDPWPIECQCCDFKKKCSDCDVPPRYEGDSERSEEK